MKGLPAVILIVIVLFPVTAMAHDPIGALLRSSMLCWYTSLGLLASIILDVIFVFGILVADKRQALKCWGILSAINLIGGGVAIVGSVIVTLFFMATWQSFITNLPDSAGFFMGVVYFACCSVQLAFTKYIFLSQYKVGLKGFILMWLSSSTGLLTGYLIETQFGRVLFG